MGVALALKLGAEVVALDSMTLYRGMDIGTAKPTRLDRGGVPHHLIDVLDPWESASVADYRARALQVVGDLDARGGGPCSSAGRPSTSRRCSGASSKGPGPTSPSAKPWRRRPTDWATRRCTTGWDGSTPRRPLRLHPNDRRRVVRALEVIQATGRPLSEQQVEHDRPAPRSVRVFALQRPRAEMMDRIDRRVEAMFAQGLVEEVRGLQAATRPLGLAASQGVGYREVIAMLEGRSTPEEALKQTQARTRQFAKRQATWFRGLVEVQPWPVEPEESAEAIADRLLARIEAGN